MKEIYFINLCWILIYKWTSNELNVLNILFYCGKCIIRFDIVYCILYFVNKTSRTTYNSVNITLWRFNIGYIQLQKTDDLYSVNITLWRINIGYSCRKPWTLEKRQIKIPVQTSLKSHPWDFRVSIAWSFSFIRKPHSTFEPG